MASQEAVRPTAPVAVPPESERRRRWALVLLAAALALDVSGVAVINSALPSIGERFDASGATLQWTMTAYAITFAGVLLLGGRAADILGRRRVFAVGIALFAVASLGAALAPALPVLIAARAVQGVGAALSGPASLALLGQIFPEGPARNRALAVYAATGASSFSAGLVAGGVLTDLFGWRSVFAVSVVAAALVLSVVRLLLPADTPQRASLDLPGALLVTVGLGLTVYGVTNGSDHGWGEPTTLTALVLAAAALAGFVVREQRAADPLLPLQIFRSNPVKAATVTGAAYYTGVSGLLFFAPLYMQDMLGYSAFESSLAVVPMGLIVVVSSHLTGRRITPAHYKPLMAASLLLIGAGVALWALTPQDGSYVTHMLPGIAVMSVGQGIGFGAMTAATLEGLPAHRHGVAGAVNVTAQQVGSSVGVAVLVAVATASGDTDRLAGYHTAYLTAAAVTCLTALLILTLPFPKPTNS
ncbi:MULTISPECIES: MFS transporter [unclassified Streptomyces]|uniref:MFS transporter n=1 Tax=unclassified Streptomyces TaxID=2593676 RepID=UPI000B24C634|nr:MULTISPECIES: MFS transporter [unclassified Streptomyces]AZM60769.1 MFS transporter [Streptomyces sp. WAC 01438]RSM96960.1 MFS transporter [Streptomyces sp. WAC 01420]